MSNDTPLKRCSKKALCVHHEQTDGGWLPASPEYFHKDKRAPLGLSYSCKECSKARARQWDEDNPERVKEKHHLDYLNKRDVRRAAMKIYREGHKPQINARTQRWRADNLEDQQEKSRIGARRRYVENPDKYRAKSRIDQSRRRHAPGLFTQEDVDLMFKSQRGCCWWCGEKFKATVTMGSRTLIGYDVDHRIPVSKGGANTPGNLCLACPKCNRSKKDKLPQEWNGRLL
jgi:5-methylcytosine-specific restriction endonuclease McrA